MISLLGTRTRMHRTGVSQGWHPHPGVYTDLLAERSFIIIIKSFLHRCSVPDLPQEAGAYGCPPAASETFSGHGGCCVAQRGTSVLDIAPPSSLALQHHLAPIRVELNPPGERYFLSAMTVLLPFCCVMDGFHKQIFDYAVNINLLHRVAKIKKHLVVAWESWWSVSSCTWVERVTQPSALMLTHRKRRWRGDTFKGNVYPLRFAVGYVALLSRIAPRPMGQIACEPGSGGKWRPREEPLVHAGGSDAVEDLKTQKCYEFLMRLQKSNSYEK